MIFVNLEIGKKNLERLPISNFVYEGASIAPQEHVKVVLQLHYVGGMQSTGSTVQGCVSPCLPVLHAVDLTWLLVCVRCEAAIVSHEFDSPRQEKLLLVSLLNFL